MSTMGIRLEVRSQESRWVKSPEGFHSTDEKKSDLMDFCSRHQIPYTCLFTCVWAMPESSTQIHQLPEGRTRWISRNADAYGREIIILGEHVVDSLAYVACGDFQNIIMEAANLEKAGKDFRSYLDKMLFLFTPAMSHVERIAQLEAASAEARRRNRLGDAEARLLSELHDLDRPQTPIDSE
jgi:hypothetical protein